MYVNAFVTKIVLLNCWALVQDPQCRATFSLMARAVMYFFNPGKPEVPDLVSYDPTRQKDALFSEN